MKNHIFLKMFLIIFAISFTFIGCNEQNSTGTTTTVNKKIVPNSPVNSPLLFPSDRLYNKNHEWIKFENDSIASMGISSYAIQLIGTTCSIDEQIDIPIVIGNDPKHLRPPTIKISLITGTADSMEFTTEFDSGLLYLKNPLVVNDPTIVSSDPYNSGWIYKLKNVDTTGGNFMNATEYENYVNSL